VRRLLAIACLAGACISTAAPQDAAEKMNRAAERVDWAAERMGDHVWEMIPRGEWVHEMSLAKEMAGTWKFDFNLAFAPPFQPYDEKHGRSADAETDRYYERGQRALDRQRWDEARDSFNEAAARGGSRADGALYWKAYAENKLGRRDDAQATLEQLRKSFPASRWLDDAKSLELEVRQAAGRPVTPEAAGDEELKLMALNGLMNSDPDRALPLLEKLLQSTQSPKVKERALFVLTQSGSVSARKLLVQIAKGGSNPDLQIKAVHYLGVMNAKQELGDVYAGTSDISVKRSVLQGLMVAGAREQLLAAAKSEKNPELRRVAIHQLGVSGAMNELWQLYQVETVVDVKREIIRALFVGGASDKLLEIARTAKEPEVRKEAIHNLGVMGADRSSEGRVAMYASDSDPAVRKEIINALFVQGNARAMVAIARKETDPELKKQIVRNLSNMGSKDGNEYMMELLNK